MKSEPDQSRRLYGEAVVNWSKMPATQIPGTSGSASVRGRQFGDFQARVIEYGPNYLGDHWCTKGHIIYVVAGLLTIEHQDGSDPAILSAGMTWYLADDEGPAHRVQTEGGAVASQPLTRPS